VHGKHARQARKRSGFCERAAQDDLFKSGMMQQEYSLGSWLGGLIVLPIQLVMPGLVPGIHVLFALK
jgi:hypothetical protein